MSKSYRIRTKLGVDQNIRVNVEQDFDFLEILSLKLRQEDVYSRFCADYGVVVGRVVANSGFGVPNARVSIFIPIEEMDLEDPVISTLYPYKKPTDKNEDGYRYNLLPYEQQYGGHNPTGTFPSRSDVLTRNEVLEIYEKYYKFTVKTNDSGDFMITGVPLGNQKLVLDMDLSDMGCFSLRPQDLIRMNMGVEEQFDGTNFKASSNLDELPQIINSVQDIDVASFWGQEDLCNIGITRADFDLRELGIEIQPTAVFMGSIFSDADSRPIKPNCKPRTEQGDICNLVTGPGEILAVRQTINVDENGDPVLEQYSLPNSGKVIDENGSFVTDIPMNLDYVVTNEFGEIVLSNDPSIGIPTKGKYRFKVKYQSEENGPPFEGDQFFPIVGEVQRANFIVPQIREYGWNGSVQNSGVDPATKDTETTINVDFVNQSQIVETKSIVIPSNTTVTIPYNKDLEKLNLTVNGVVRNEKWIEFPNGGTLTIEVTKITTEIGNPPQTVGQNVTVEVKQYDYDYIQFQKSYAFSLDWDEYADKQAAINCEDSFYLMNYNKVYTPSMMIDEYRKGYGRARFLGIKEILDRGCESETNRFPTNDGVRNFDLLFLIVNLVITLFTPLLFAVTVIGHVICFLWPVLRILLTVILTVIFTLFVLLCNIVNGVAWLFGAKINCPKYSPIILPRKCPLSAIPLPNLSYPDCQACACEGRDAGQGSEDNLPEIEANTTLLIDTNVNTFYDDLIGYHDDEQADWTKYLYGFQTVMAGNDIYGDEQNSLAPWLRGKNNPQAKAKTWSRDLTLSERFNLFNVKSKYHQYGGQNRIDTYVNPNQNNFKKHSDNVLMLLLDPGQLSVFKAGQIVTFNDPELSKDPNISGGTTGTTVFQNQGNANVTVTYMDPDTLGSVQKTYTITGQTNSSQDYQYPTDIEYFQVITGQTLEEYENTLNNSAKGLSSYGTPNNTLGQFYVFGWQKVKKYYILGSKNPDEYPDANQAGGDYFVNNVPNIKLNSDWKDHCIVFLTRGVDPNTPRQDIKYDLSKLYGYSMGNGPQIRGNYKMNIPIQPYPNANNDWRIPRHNKIGANGQVCSETGKGIYFNSFTFTPNSGMYQTYFNHNIKYYSAMDENNTLYNQNVKKENKAVRSPQSIWESWSRMEGDGTGNDWYFNYRNDEVVEGGSLLMSKDTTIPEEGDWSYASPVYYKINANMSMPMLNSQKIVMRTDRLPTSDDTYKRFSLHQNKRFAIYTVDDDGSSVSYNLESSDSFGDGADDFNEDAGSIATQISQTFSCDGMVPLECYSGNGETIGVLPEDDRCYYISNKKEIKKMYGGCYYLLTKNFAFAEDFQSIAEWRARFRMMFGLCNNVVSLTFVNNWVNGSLYMYAFQKDDVYGNNINETTFTSNPEYVYCKDTAVYQLVTNSFYYRASPYNPNNNLGERFIGRDNTPQTNILGRSNGANKKFLGNPTTIMDLGPRDLFTKEICYNPEFQGYIVDKISTSSYKDTSDVLQLFAISRLTASGFWESVIGFGDGSIQKLFSRDNQRLDGDISQLLSINSEFGVVPYLGTNYSDSEIRYIGETRTLSNGRVVKDPTLGILFSANTINRDMISPGRYTFQDTLTSHLVDNYGHQDQEVPFHKWEIISTGSTIFGTQQNDWYSKKSQDGIGSVRYQTEDRLTSQDTFSTNVNMPSTQRPGYIYNSNIVNNQIETTDDKPNPFRNVIHAGSPYFFYFGLRKGASSMNRFIDKFIFNQEKL
jgi:hypothetical protein